MKLIDAFRVDAKTRLSIVGAGGKTSSLIRLGCEWPGICIAAATAHIGKNQIKCFKNHKILHSNFIFEGYRLSESTLFTGPEGNDNRLNGIEPQFWNELYRISEENDVPIFIEADGSKMKPLKAPAAHEPPIPDWVNHVVVSVGISVLGKPLAQEFVHRPEIFSSLTGLEMGKPVTWHAIFKMLTHPQGGLKNIPRYARKSVLLNQIDSLSDNTGLPTFCHQVLSHYDSVIIAKLNNPSEQDDYSKINNEVICVEESIAGIILAAGNSSRMGQPKAFLNWKGEPFIRVCALQAISAGLDPVIIIAGQEYERIRNILQDIPVHVIHNPDWNEGQSSSIRTAINSIPKHAGGAIFQLVDQPHIPVALLRRLKYDHSRSLSPIVLPESIGRRANPVLFDRITFKSLSTIQGDVGGRVIFSQYPIKTIQWFDDSILIDVDTPDDYSRLLASQS
jgi:molybdenum cofactor cytidylyltransferase